MVCGVNDVVNTLDSAFLLVVGGAPELAIQQGLEGPCKWVKSLFKKLIPKDAVPLKCGRIIVIFVVILALSQLVWP